MASQRLFETVLLLVGAVVVLEVVARRLRLPPAAAFVGGGIVLALVPGSPELVLDPDLAMVLFLPPLLLSGAYNTVWQDFRTDLRIILQLAVGAVAFTTAAVGVVAHWMLPSLPWAACFALGAIVSPPDAVAAKAVLNRVRLPRRMVVLLEGESLVNDATGLVLFRFAVLAAVTGGFSAGQAALSFGTLAVGGVAAGLAIGWMAVQVLRRFADPYLSITASLLVGWGSYIGADAIGVSGVLATVACGLVLGTRQHREFDATTRVEARAVWQVLVFVLESLVFILIGLSLRGVLVRVGGSWAAAAAVLLPVSAVVAAVVLARFAWIVPAVYLPRLLLPAARRQPRPPAAIPLVMGWAGMRGVVSLAAALSLPEGFPGRDIILVATFAVILVTVLVQGSTLEPLIRRLRLAETGLPSGGGLSLTEARMRMARAQLDAVRDASTAPDGTERHPRLVEQFTHRVQASTRFHEAAGGLAQAKSEHFRVVLAAIAAGRSELLRLARQGTLHESVLTELEQELDLEEVTTRRHLG